MVFTTLLLCGGTLSSCSDDDNGNNGTATTGQLTLKLVQAESVSATFELTSSNVSECAYMVAKAAEATEPTQDIIYARGTHFNVSEATTQFVVSNIEPDTDYIIYLVGRSGDHFVGNTVNATFKTTDFTDPVTITARKHDGFSVHFKLPQEVKERGNAIRFTRGVLPMYNSMKMNMGTVDADFLLMNGGDSRVATNDMTYIFDAEHSQVYDPAEGEYVPIDDPIVPGEPSVLMAGEFAKGTNDMVDWGEGYFNPLFDREGYEAALGGGVGGGDLLLDQPQLPNEADYWSGFYHKEIVVNQKPAILNDSVKFTTPVLSPIKATLRFEPGKNVERYCVLVCDEGLLNGMLLPLLNNSQEYLQWFITSYMGFAQLGAQSFEGTTEISLSEFQSEEGIRPGVTFHVLLTAMSGEHGLMQRFQHFTFTTPERTQAAPTIAVKPIDNPNGPESPFDVWFNIKSTGSVPVAKCKYVANYEREMEYMFKKGETVSSLVESKGQLFSEQDIQQINSAEGLNVRFDSRANANTYFAAVGYNEEGLASEGQLAKKRTISIPAGNPVSSPYFKALQGEWTASATVSVWNSQTNSWGNPTNVKFKVDIAQGVTYPETVPDYVYDLYASMTTAEVDALYADFKKQAKDYGQRLKTYNSLLCTGFNYYGMPEPAYKSPFDLFADEKYSAYNNEALFYDFGPKWFLTVKEDGTVSVPVNINQLAPLSNWETKFGHSLVSYLVGLGRDSYISQPAKPTDKWPSFPVKVSEDMNTITIEPIKSHDNNGNPDTFYPNVIQMTHNGAQPVNGCKVTSAVTLTKGWTPVNTLGIFTKWGKLNAKSVQSANGAAFTPKLRPAARTIFNLKAQSVQHKTIKLMTIDQAKKNMNALCEKWINSLRKSKK